MSDLTATAPFDLTRFSEVIRRRLYDRITQIQFLRPGNAYTPDEARLQVVYLAGRWFAVWVDLNEPAELPEHLRFRIMRIGASQAEPEAIELYEI